MGDPNRAVGLTRLVEELGLAVPYPKVRSELVAGARKTRIADGAIVEQYPKSYAREGVIAHLRFGMRYEPLDPGVLYAVFRALPKRVVEDWIRSEPTGLPARRAWYLFELLTGDILDVPDVPATGYVDLLNPELHVTGLPIRIRRQRINDNLLGNREYCPLIRRTHALRTAMSEGLDSEARLLLANCDPQILARAVNYLYTKETKSSFAIEGEVAPSGRAERFVAALSHAETFDATQMKNLVGLQNTIVDPRYAATGWSTVQNFVGQTRSDYSEQVHFVCPKPEDLPQLMAA